MILELKRYSHNKESTLGLLFWNRKFQCYTIEDAPQKKKIAGITRIPSGIYELGIRKEGGFHNRYSKKFPDFHQGMIQIKDVPGFKYILIHIGNSAKDSQGCILVGNSPNNNAIADGFVGHSTTAYRSLYKTLIGGIKDRIDKCGHGPFMIIEDEDEL